MAQGKLVLVTASAHHSGVVTQFNSKETISSRRPRRWVALSSPIIVTDLKLLCHFWFNCFCHAFFTFLIASTSVALLEEHSLVGNASNLYFVIRRSPGNSHPGTGPAHYKYLRHHSTRLCPPIPSSSVSFYVTCIFLLLLLLTPILLQ